MRARVPVNDRCWIASLFPVRSRGADSRRYPISPRETLAAQALIIRKTNNKMMVRPRSK